MSVYRDPRNGYWGHTLSYNDDQGRKVRKRVSLGKGATRKDAECAERDGLAAARERRFGALREAGLGKDAPIAPVPFSGFAKKFYEEWVLSRCKRSSQRTHEQILRVHFHPSFGHRDLRSIAVRDLDAYVAKCRLTLAAKTVQNHLALLGKLFACAVDWGFVTDNPVRRMQKLKVEEKDFRYLDADGATAFLAAARTSDPDYYPLFLTALSTGMRQGELLGLTWGQIDFRRAVIRVSQSRVLGHDGTPKSGRIREVDMSPGLASELATMPRRGSYVFCSPNGAPLTPDMVKHRFWRARDASGADPALYFHQLRHSFASQLVIAGVPLPVVQKLLGHSEIKMTMRYAHLAPGATKSAVEKLSFSLPSLCLVETG